MTGRHSMTPPWQWKRQRHLWDKEEDQAKESVETWASVVKGETRAKNVPEAKK